MPPKTRAQLRKEAEEEEAAQRPFREQYAATLGK